MNLTDQKIEDWRVRYHKSMRDHDLTPESLKEIIVLTPEEYSRKYDKEVDAEEPEQDITQDLDAMKAVAGVPVTTTAPVNDFTESLRVAAGIK